MGAFGTEFAKSMAVAWYRDGTWSEPAIGPVEPLSLHPAAHVLHYASTCFEGLKAYRHADGSVHAFRLDRHVARMARSAELLCLPVPEAPALERTILSVVAACRDEVPPYPGALYLRPGLFGTEPNIGSAGRPAREACFMVLASPVGAYFRGDQALRILIDDRHMRSTPDFGVAKTGGNYAAALRHVVAARRDAQADQVLFCPGGDVQETGAANFLLLDGERVVTRELDGALLHGVTRDSILQLARTMGYATEERALSVDELLAWAQEGEAALSGTAAVLTGVGTLLYRGAEHAVNGGATGPNTIRLRDALAAIHSGAVPDELGWLTKV